MGIDYLCDNCSAELNVGAEWIGNQVKCKHCAFVSLVGGKRRAIEKRPAVSPGENIVTSNPGQGSLPPLYESHRERSDKLISLRTNFNLFLIFELVSIFSLVIMVPMTDQILFLGMGFITSLMGLGFFWWFVCVGWNALQVDGARTTGAQAIGFMFIPLFNIYWIFVVFAGLGKAMEKSHYDRIGTSAPLTRGLGLAQSIIWVVSMITSSLPDELIVIYFMMLVVQTVITICFIHQLRESLLNLINAEV